MHTLRILRSHTAACMATMLALAVMAAPAVQAQQVYDVKDHAWWDNLEEQLTASLYSDVQQVQVEALQHVVFFATHYKAQVDFADATPQLLTLFAPEQSESMRLMALAALHATSDAYAMKQLQALVETETSDRIRQVTTATLQDYYARYQAI